VRFSSARWSCVERIVRASTRLVQYIDEKDIAKVSTFSLTQKEVSYDLISYNLVVSNTVEYAAPLNPAD
jgi:hypothetical protein